MVNRDNLEGIPSGGRMGWFRRKQKPGGTSADRVDLSHLEQFVQTRRGVEAYLEPQTNVTAITLLLIAHDGEWTRRRIGSAEAAYAFGHRMSIPVYDANTVGYPQRMRDWNSRQRTKG